MAYIVGALVDCNQPAMTSHFKYTGALTLSLARQVVHAFQKIGQSIQGICTYIALRVNTVQKLLYRGSTVYLHRVRQFFSIKLRLFYPSIGTVLLTTHIISFFEYQQHMFWLRNNKIIFLYALLSGRL